MPKFIINGDFLCRNLTGIERFAYEICVRLDKIIEKDFIGIFIPKNAKVIPSFENIKIYVSDKNIKSFPRWSFFNYGSFLIKHKAIGIDFSNTCSIRKPGVVFLHDIYCKVFPEDFNGFRDNLVRLYSCFMYRFVAKHSKKLLTVSNYSKKQIATTYKIEESSIDVIPNGWEHFDSVKPDNSIFEKFPKLNNDFYFTLGSLSKRKNLKWIADYAVNHQDETFAISGKMLSGLVPAELEVLKSLDNVVLLGYVSDGEVKALMQKCKAFILPSYYEGFGIPPLEALSCGAKIVISNAACLPEIYGDSAYYIDPNNANVNLTELIMEERKNPLELLQKYTYQNAAEKFYEVLKNIS